ncbi:MAG: histidine triad nucleotide-binding protein [Chloroflexi bacterium 44-23]|nr:MAG: histidine triad nucleotide-binding protein [Chloroflexi bacterium 44-23]
MSVDCVFCQIIGGKIPTKIIYKDNLISVFEDIDPIAPIHYLLVPNRHIPSLNEIDAEDAGLLSHLVLVAKDFAVHTGISATGYRLMINTGKDGSQTVDHLHMHLIGGRKLLGRIVS